MNRINKIANRIAAKKEYYIWGIPKGSNEEVILLSKVEGVPLRSMAEANKYKKILEDKYGARKTRVQELDMEGEFDWLKETGLKK